MENIKEELRQLTKNKILSAIMEAKKCKKCNHPPSGASHQRPKSWNKGSKDGTRQTQDRREGKKQAAQLDENEFITLGALLGAGAVGLGIDALRQKFLFPKNIAKLKANLVPTQKVPTVPGGRAISNEVSDYDNQFKLHRDRLESIENRRARIEERLPKPIDPEKVHDSVIRSHNSALNASIKRNIPSTWI